MRKIVSAVAATAVALIVFAPSASAKPSIKIKGALTVGSTIKVTTKGGKATKVKWQSCPAGALSNGCRSTRTIGSGRSLTLDASLSGLSVRATARVGGRKVATRWSAPIGGRSGRVVVPAGWEVTGGSPSNITSNQREISDLYAAIAELVGGGRSLEHLESAGGGAIFSQINLTLCSDKTFKAIELGSPEIVGTWKMTVDFSSPNDLAPRLLLTASTSDTFRVTLNAAKPGHVSLNNLDFISSPSSTCT